MRENGWVLRQHLLPLNDVEYLGIQIIPLTRGVSHCGLAIYKIIKYLKGKEELWKFKCITMQRYNLEEILQMKPKSFKILYLYITNLKFQHKPKY